MTDQKFNLKTFIDEYPDAKHLKIKLAPGMNFSDEDLAKSFEKGLGKLRRELEAERNRSVSETEVWIENIKTRNRLNRRNSTKSLMVRCITNYALDGSYHPNLRNIELCILNKDGSIYIKRALSYAFFDEVVIREWELTSKYGLVSWYKEKEVKNESHR